MSDEAFRKVIKGNIKTKRPYTTINMSITFTDLKDLEEACERECMTRNKYLAMALDHYFKCDDVNRS